MTQAEKAKRYDEALEKARSFYKRWDGISASDSNLVIAEVKEIFPELKESEDENIRKELLEHCIDRVHGKQVCVDASDYRRWADWLFRIGEENTPNVKSDEVIRNEIIKFLELPHPQFVGKRNHEKWIAWLEKQDSHYTFEIKMGHWYTCVCDYMLNGSDLMFKNGRLYYCRSDWRLEGEIDERNVKDIGVHGYKSFFRPATNQEIKDWLEKQGEQKPRYSIGDVLCDKSCTTLNKESQPNFEIIDIRNGMYICDKCSFPISQQDEYELVAKRIEQKPADKVEPKFHEGDWIIHYGTENIYKVVAIIDNQYQLKYGDNYTVQNCTDVDRCARLWDIAKDAKYGDVLSDKYDNIGIFQECEGICWHSYIYLGCDGELRGFNIGGSHEQTDTHPATKEQRDTLLKAMVDAGYKWDSENKILLSLKAEPNSEQKPAWSEGDEKRIASILSVLSVQVCWDGATGKKMNPYQKEIDWLKSLKPKKQWKPTDEQMDALVYIIQHYTPAVTDALGWESLRTVELMISQLRKR